jgi:hypothetical protein
MSVIVHRRSNAQRSHLTLSEQGALAAEIALTYARVRLLLLRGRDMREAVTSIRERARPFTGDTLSFARHLGAIVDGYLRRLPGDTRCLTRSLVLLTMLSRRGLGGNLVIGVRTAPSFGAHAWVELDGRPLLQPIEPTGQRLVEL